MSWKPCRRPECPNTVGSDRSNRAHYCSVECRLAVRALKARVRRRTKSLSLLGAEQAAPVHTAQEVQIGPRLNSTPSPQRAIVARTISMTTEDADDTTDSASQDNCIEEGDVSRDNMYCNSVALAQLAAVCAAYRQTRQCNSAAPTSVDGGVPVQSVTY
ncbi:Uncharacterized protein PBTT_06216 [Plasmodiophora brassicae]|uniref:Uncharacterized protein n=1 Tax=Plasmodiophora brassicae TaxID=37360 RepID=A0A0G4IV57_PLABS|nr:hypothetical protein PBRA_007115 [Plasmodiophora brassicae]SPQ98556.1 unnamed protein product [Plasmodiophora brassicae]